MTEDSEEAKADEGAIPGRSVAVGCFVLVAGVIALVLVVVSALIVTSVARNSEPEPGRPEIVATIVNKCEIALRAGWMLSDSAVPLTSADAEGFFPPLRVGTRDSDARATENQTHLIDAGSSGLLGFGRPGTADRERILLVETVSATVAAAPDTVAAPDSVASLAAYSLKPSSFDLTQGAFPMVFENDPCAPQGLERIALP